MANLTIFDSCFASNYRLTISHPKGLEFELLRSANRNSKKKSGGEYWRSLHCANLTTSDFGLNPIDLGM